MLFDITMILDARSEHSFPQANRKDKVFPFFLYKAMYASKNGDTVVL